MTSAGRSTAIRRWSAWRGPTASPARSSIPRLRRMRRSAASPPLPGCATASISSMSRMSASMRRSEEHTSELQSLMRISYAVFCSKKKQPCHAYRQHPRIPTDQDLTDLEEHRITISHKYTQHLISDQPATAHD